jgi:CheY-like chemotaxis protein
MSNAQGSQKLILVVDDEPDVIAFLTTLLEDNGYKTISARDGQEALTTVNNQKPDLISLDITMPEKSGVRFYRDVKNDPNLKSIPVVIVTGVSDDFQKFISTRKQVPPPEGYIAKPIEEAKYLDTIKQLIGS